MKKSIYQFTMVVLVTIMFGCKKEDSPAATTTSAVDGNWKYESNIGGGCNDLVGTIWKVGSGVATATSVPNNGFGWKTGDNFLSNITQTTSPNNFTATGFSRSAGGAVQNSNIKVDIVVATGAQSMTVTYTSVCNPVQRWVKN